MAELILQATLGDYEPEILEEAMDIAHKLGRSVEMRHNERRWNCTSEGYKLIISEEELTGMSEIMITSDIKNETEEENDTQR